MPELKPEQLLLVAGFVLPGAISMYVYGLKVPQRDYRLQEKVLEAVCFSLLNFLVVWWPLRSMIEAGAGTTSGVVLWAVALLVFVGLPIVWPFMVVGLLRFAQKRRWISAMARTAWDDFFARPHRGFWLQVELTDGRLLGGRFGSRSFASSYPDPGHLFIEELWRVDQEGCFVDRWPGRPGLLLRPADYRLIRVYEGVDT